MKEKSFRFRESFGRAIKAMDDKQAGRFIKGLCDNVFAGKYFESNDAALKSTYILVKSALEAEVRDRENGRKGGIMSAEKRKTEGIGIRVIARVKEPDYPVEDILKGILAAEEAADNTDKGE